MKIKITGTTPHPPEADGYGLVVLKLVREQKDRYLSNSATADLNLGVTLPKGAYLLQSMVPFLRPDRPLYLSDGETPMRVRVRNEGPTGIAFDDGMDVLAVAQVQVKSFDGVDFNTPEKDEKAA
jgi:hypothetical protein